MISDPLFYLVAVPAVILFGVAKGGFGGSFGVVAVPLMALAVSPAQAAAVLLPILCLMDLVSMWVYRGRWVLPELYLLLPAALVGIGIGTLAFEYMSPAIIRLLLGVVALVFSLHYWWQTRHKPAAELAQFKAPVGALAATAAGFTSFIAHAGGPPLSMYLLRRGLDRTGFVATCTVFFTLVNYTKLIPYGYLGLLDVSNLSTSLLLAPLAPLGVGIGVFLHRRISDRFFFRFAYALLFLVGLKLVFDGLAGV